MRFQCPQCDHRSKERSNIAAHITQRHGMEVEGYSSYKCPFPGCKNVRRTQWDLNHHYKTHMPQSCEICNERFPSPQYLETHMVNVHGEDSVKARAYKQYTKTSQCSECGMVFKSKDALKNHLIRNHDKNAEAKFLCTECGKRYKLKQDLTVHWNMMHAHKKVICKLCPPPKSGGKPKEYVPQVMQIHMRTVH